MGPAGIMFLLGRAAGTFSSYDQWLQTVRGQQPGAEQEMGGWLLGLAEGGGGCSGGLSGPGLPQESGEG